MLLDFARPGMSVCRPNFTLLRHLRNPRILTSPGLGTLFFSFRLQLKKFGATKGAWAGTLELGFHALEGRRKADVKSWVGAFFNPVVTGATAGIGKDFALQLAKGGFNILLASRSVSKLEEIRAEISSFPLPRFPPQTPHADFEHLGEQKQNTPTLKLEFTLLIFRLLLTPIISPSVRLSNQWMSGSSVSLLALLCSIPEQLVEVLPFRFSQQCRKKLRRACLFPKPPRSRSQGHHRNQRVRGCHSLLPPLRSPADPSHPRLQQRNSPRNQARYTRNGCPQKGFNPHRRLLRGVDSFSPPRRLLCEQSVPHDVVAGFGQ